MYSLNIEFNDYDECRHFINTAEKLQQSERIIIGIDQFLRSILKYPDKYNDSQIDIVEDIRNKLIQLELDAKEND